MTPYISHRSTSFIIFIISINILSVVCVLYEPIKEDPVVKNQRKFTYFNYLRTENQNAMGLPSPDESLKKLDVDQYYYSYYSDKYWTMPDVKNERTYNQWKEKHISYCDQEYVSNSHFKTTYHVAEFGVAMNNLRECLKTSRVVKTLRLCCGPNRSKDETVAKCLEVLENREVVTTCLETFKTGVSQVFGKKPEDLEFTETSIGIKAQRAFSIATAQAIPNEFNDEAFVDLLANYKEFTGDTTYTDDTDKFKKECSQRFKNYELKVFLKWRSTYNVLEGFNNFKEFSRQIKIALKYLEGLEGKLVNNKKLYDKFHNNPISEKDYLELFIPLPRIHEHFYALYFLRLKFLGYIPVDEPTWNKQMIYLSTLSSKRYIPVDEPTWYKQMIYLSNKSITESQCEKLPIFKNGSSSDDLKDCKSSALHGNFALSYTCAFDALASLIMVSYCDSNTYSKKIDSSHNEFFNFISKVVKNGITSETYCTRADLIINNTKPDIMQLKYGTKIISCDTTITNLVNSMFKEFPSVTEKITRSSNCQPTVNSSKLKIYLSYVTENGKIQNLQSFLDNCLQSVQSTYEYTDSETLCKIVTEVKPDISDMHLFIDIFYWEGDRVVSNDRISETAKQVKMRLSDIPKMLVYNNIIYELRGVISFYKPKSESRTSLGHYNAYALRGSKNWQLLDDFKEKPIPINENKEVSCELLVYTV